MVKVLTAVQRELRDLGEAPRTRSALASSAEVLARMLDDPATADTARTAAARELRETMAVLRARAELVGAGGDRMSEFERRQAERAAAG